MLDCLPIYHWFHCGNPYSGAQGGMRYLGGVGCSIVHSKSSCK